MVKGVLRPTEAVYYHPMNNLIDIDGVTWVTPLSASFFPDSMVFTTPGKLGDSGAAANGGISSPAYPAAGGLTRMTTAFWLRKTGGVDVFVGHGGASDNLQMIALVVGGATAGRVVLFRGADGAGIVIANNGTVPIGATGFHLYVLDVAREGGDWVLRWSVDGSPLAAAPPVTAAGPINPPADGMIATRGHEMDEVVFWRDLPEPFTAQELSNLFDLADIFGEGMNRFQENFAAPLCWQATARMPDGTVWRDSGSGSCPPVLRVPKGAENIMVTDDGSPSNPRIIEG